MCLHDTIQRNRQLEEVVEDNAVQTDYYEQKKMTPEMLQGSQTEHMKKKKIASVRESVQKQIASINDERLKAGQAEIQSPYKTIDEIRNEEEDAQRRKRLHHSRGTRLSAEGHHVLDFDIAGSGFKQFRSDYRGAKGKSEIRDYMKVESHWYNKIFGWLPGIKSVKQLQKDAKKRAKDLIRNQEQPMTANEAYNVDIMRKAGDRWMKTEVDAEGNVITEKAQQKHIRQSVSADGRKTRITMAGPLALKGMSNSGDYSIENLKEYMLTAGKSYLEGIFRNWENGGERHEIWIRIRGHSRGGVASVQGAMMIKKWLLDTYGDYANYVKFELTQFDPVPGTGSRSGMNKEVSMASVGGVESERMAPLGDSAETTVVYSLHSDHMANFTPQEVKGTKRIIITPFAHSVGLGEVDEQNTTQGGSAHRMAFTDAATGEAYRLSSLNELPEGVYMLDEHNTLVRFDDMGMLEGVMKQVLDKTRLQGKRHEIVKRVAAAWFESHADSANQGP